MTPLEERRRRVESCSCLYCGDRGHTKLQCLLREEYICTGRVLRLTRSALDDVSAALRKLKMEFQAMPQDDVDEVTTMLREALCMIEGAPEPRTEKSEWEAGSDLICLLD